MTFGQHRAHSVPSDQHPVEGVRERVQQLRRGTQVHLGREGRVRRHQVLRPARRHAAPHRPRDRVRPELHRQRHRVRRLLRPRLPGDQRVRHGAVPGPADRAARPVPQAQDAQHELLRARPDHGRALQPRPAQRRPQGRAVPGLHRRRRHLLLRRRGGVLHLRLGALRYRVVRELPPHRLRRGLVEHRPRGGRRQPRLQGPLQGRATSRCRRWTTTRTCATTWSPT